MDFIALLTTDHRLLLGISSRHAAWVLFGTVSHRTFIHSGTGTHDFRL